MLIKFRGIEFNAETLTYGRNNKPAEADFLGTDSDSQDGKLDNMDFHVKGYIYGKKLKKSKSNSKKPLKDARVCLLCLTAAALGLKLRKAGTSPSPKRLTTNTISISVSKKLTATAFP